MVEIRWYNYSKPKPKAKVKYDILKRIFAKFQTFRKFSPGLTPWEIKKNQVTRSPTGDLTKPQSR